MATMLEEKLSITMAYIENTIYRSFEKVSNLSIIFLRDNQTSKYYEVFYKVKFNHLAYLKREEDGITML